jgi:signal peptidase II
VAAPARLAGASLALLALLVDQAHKAWMLGPYAIEARGRVAVTPFLDLVMVWNTGVSYGLLAEEHALWRWVLVLVGLGGAVLFGYWLWQTRRILPALALGLVIGGALSNVIDRLVHGAVADFFLLHAGRFEWYVFNLADVWIVAGAAGLLLTWATERGQMATEP